MFPGCPLLDIKAMDYDDIFGDDLIGETTVDLEDRFFSAQWQRIKEKPVEQRQLYHPSTKVSQGVLKMWVEVHPSSTPKSEITLWDLRPRPPQEFQVRVVVWDTEDVVCEDWEGTSDVFVRAFLDSTRAQETDTHFRCQDGKGSFNYRLVFDVRHPGDSLQLSVQVWDRDIFKSNDFIGDAAISLKLPIADAVET